MVRPLRLEYEGAVYHVTSRGNAREAIFLDDVDRARFLEVLGDVVARYDWICHAYCLMPNHYHLLIETPEANLSRGMHLLNGVYTQWFNHRYKRVGHLLQGRFKAILVEKQSHLLELARYIVLNPRRAKMARTVRKWPWSSYRATSGQARVPEFLTVDWILSQFDTDRERAVRAYRLFVRRKKRIDVWEELRAGMFIGTATFVKQLKPLLTEKAVDPEIRKRERFAARPSLEDLFSDIADEATRNERIHQAVRVHHYTLKEVGDLLGLHFSTISIIAKRVDEAKKNQE
ncbi:MAG TPA: addiction module toxin RelE [Candidatus Acetothermia bacterium]|nr:addiction module toxin RelE [Candidatus Acetothermia bacterium]